MTEYPTATVSESQPSFLHGFILPDDKVFGLEQKLKNEEYILIQSGNGTNYKFYYEDDIMYAVNIDDESIKHKIIKESDRESVENKHKSFRNHLKNRIKNDFPEMPEEQLNQDADILSEANESIKNLMLKGIPSEIAKEIIMIVLQTPAELQTPEKLAELISNLSSDIKSDE